MHGFCRAKHRHLSVGAARASAAVIWQAVGRRPVPAHFEAMGIAPRHTKVLRRQLEAFTKQAMNTSRRPALTRSHGQLHEMRCSELIWSRTDEAQGGTLPSVLEAVARRSTADDAGKLSGGDISSGVVDPALRRRFELEQRIMLTRRHYERQRTQEHDGRRTSRSARAYEPLPIGGETDRTVAA